jgi:hypothetical protein
MRGHHAGDDRGVGVPGGGQPDVGLGGDDPEDVGEVGVGAAQQ